MSRSPVARFPRSHIITPVLRSLHWLLIRLRTIYKTLFLTYQTWHHLIPSHHTRLKELFVIITGLLDTPFHRATLEPGTSSYSPNRVGSCFSQKLLKTFDMHFVNISVYDSKCRCWSSSLTAGTSLFLSVVFFFMLVCCFK